MRSPLTLKGNAKDGYILAVKDKRSFQDIALTHEELHILSRILTKKLTSRKKRSPDSKSRSYPQDKKRKK